MSSIEWETFVKRLVGEARKNLKSNKDGLAIVRSYVVVNASGEPVLWVVPDALKVEPTKSAMKHLLDTISDVS